MDVKGLFSVYWAPVIESKSNFPTVDVQGLYNVYSAPVVDGKINYFIDWLAGLLVSLVKLTENLLDLTSI